MQHTQEHKESKLEKIVHNVKHKFKHDKQPQSASATGGDQDTHPHSGVYESKDSKHKSHDDLISKLREREDSSPTISEPKNFGASKKELGQGKNVGTANIGSIKNTDEGTQNTVPQESNNVSQQPSFQSSLPTPSTIHQNIQEQAQKDSPPVSQQHKPSLNNESHIGATKSHSIEKLTSNDSKDQSTKGVSPELSKLDESKNVSEPLGFKDEPSNTQSFNTNKISSKKATPEENDLSAKIQEHPKYSSVPHFEHTDHQPLIQQSEIMQKDQPATSDLPKSPDSPDIPLNIRDEKSASQGISYELDIPEDKTTSNKLPKKSTNSSGNESGEFQPKGMSNIRELEKDFEANDHSVAHVQGLPEETDEKHMMDKVVHEIEEEPVHLEYPITDLPPETEEKHQMDKVVDELEHNKQEQLDNSSDAATKDMDSLRGSQQDTQRHESVNIGPGSEHFMEDNSVNKRQDQDISTEEKRKNDSKVPQYRERVPGDTLEGLGGLPKVEDIRLQDQKEGYIK
eukprot:NODE_231_length_13709_cov_0.444526.p3 type:complete len:512 gc:universal NODE_231_length_13709_cov_0.444526:3791-2256(-)